MNQWRDYRNYEVSVWTLLDNYIATLKSGDPIFVTDSASPAVAWPQARAQGQILNGQMELNIDGTQTLSFDIPMYLFIDGQLVENPNWYNNISENILVSMRKIKVIFNKQDGMNYTAAAESDEYELERKRLYVERSNNTFEFIITKVSETHELDNLMCHVECEGLAFHELGKIGYKRALSTDEYLNEYNAWKAATEDSGTNLQEPINNIQYWLKKACIDELPDNCKSDGYIDAELLNPNNWYYDIRMAHTSLMSMGPVALTDNIIYEEGFITDWTDEGVPLSYEETRERRRLVDIAESNLYNITLDLAEIFEVFCRYEYLYDTNYNIIGRIIVFYNNFLQEGKDVLTLMYPNSASKITREMDSSNISTKMFVRSATNDNVYSGESNIMECSANRSKEDYLLNFDYLHDIGTITELLYKLIGSFELSMRKFNNKLIPLLNAANTLSNLKTSAEAKVKSLNELIDLDKERITENDNLIYAIDAADGDADGYITRDYRNPEVLALLKDSSNAEYDTYYVQLNLNDKCRGIVPSSLELYKDYKLTSTTTKKYSVGFKSFSSKLKDAYVAGVPSIEGHTSFNEGKWVDYALEFKGTIGEKPDITALPNTADVGTKYKALDEDYPYPFKINRGQYLEYDGKTWLVKDDNPPEGTKTIGKSANLQSLPDKPELGWIYLVATEGYEINNTSYRLGTLIIRTDENTWTYYLPPTIVYRKAETTEITDNNLNNLYIKVNNTYTRTTEKKVDTKTSNKYYVRKKNYDKTGFFIYTKISTDLKNGITSATYKSMRYGALDTNIDYVSQIRLLYYVTESKLNPDPEKPTLATSSTSETEILNYEELGKWSSYLSAPEVVTNNTWLYKCWETSFSLSKKIFSDVTNVQYNDDNAKDANNEKIATKIANAHDTFLQEKDKILNGIYEYDSYHNLDKVTGLFRSYKKGSYYLYGTTSTNNYTLSNKQTSTDIDNIIANVFSSINAKEVPSDHLGKYVLIKEQVYYNNNNSGMRYYFKYYDEHDTPVDPDNPAKAISSIEPIFYLDTKGTAPSTSISEAQSSSASDVWTTAFPVSTKSTWTYYVGWKVTNYANDSFYYYKGTATYKIKLKKVDLENTDDIPKYIYATFKYKPDLYYEKIKASWVKKLEKDTASLEKYKNKFSYLKQAYEKTEALIKSTKDKKEKEIREFENMMGAALRESYWQPEDEYQDNGARYEEEYTLFLSELYNTKDTGTFFNNMTDKQFSSIGWDSYLFDDELDFYYEYSINKNKVYYPCIDLTLLTKTISGTYTSFLQSYKRANESERKLYSVFFNNSMTDLIPSSGDSWDVRYCLHYSIGSEVQFAFLRDSSGTIKPILIVLGAENLPDDEIDRLKANGCLGLLSLLLSEGVAPNDGGIYAAQLLASKLSSYELKDAWISKETLKASEIVFPRIIIPSLKLKTDSDNLVLKYNGTALENYKDYYVFARSYYNATDMDDINTYYQINEKTYIKYKYKNLENIKVSENIATRMQKTVTYYTITIKPEFFLNTIDLHNVSTINKFKIFYALSNADLSIYLDAKKILKENAYPKVSYAIEISKWSPDLLKNIHGKLALLVMINDTDLKLRNTFGYISSVKLDLDHEEKDSVEVKNYKTKFEDLFSKIVAQTEAMQKSSYNIGLAGALAGGAGLSVPLSPEGFEATLGDLSVQEELLEFISEYFDDLSVVQTKLSEMWNEAGVILASAANSLNSAMSATTLNATILAGFRENVIAALSPKVFTGKELPTDFKPGDIWINEDDKYFAVATGYSGRNGGFTRTHDGSLAEIKGANVLFDAETGIVDITGEAQINLMSGKNIYIAANDTVDIVGNKAVNIGGVTINMGSANIIGNGYPGEPGSGGIHLVATDYYYTTDEDEDGDGGSLSEGGSSRVDVTGEGIEMASKNGIVIKSGAGIDIKSSDNENVSAIAIDKDKGIYLGATKGLTLYSGDAANYFYGPDNPILNGLASEGDYWVECDAVQFPLNPTKIQKGYDHEGGYYRNIITKNNSKVAVSLEVNYYYMNRSSMTNIKYHKAYYNESTGVLNWTDITLADIDILGATACLTRDSLLLGMANVGSDSATAISMTTDEIILAAGKDLSQIKVLDGKVTDFSAATLSGLLIQKDYIGLAIGTGNDRSLLSLNPTLVQLGLIRLNSGYEVVDTWDPSEKDTSKTYLVPRSSDEYYNKYYYSSKWEVEEKVGPEQFSGSYLWLGNEEIYLGTGGHLTVNTNNIKIQSKNLSEKKGVSSDSSDYVIGMGFALGNRLLTTYVPPQPGESDNAKAAREAANPDIGLGFWIDGSGGKHLLVDANEIKLGGDPVASLLTILNTVPYETLRLYKLHDSKDTAPSAPNGYTWKDIYDAEYSSTADSPFLNSSIGGWQQGLPSPANADESGNKYVWSIIQYTYKIDESSKYKFMASNPVYEGLVDKLTQKSYKLYKYFTNTPATNTALSENNLGWTESIPEGSYTVEYYYNDILCTKGSDITEDTNLNTSETPTSIPTVRYLKSNNHTITFYRLVNNVWTEVSEKCMKGYWFVYTEAETGINRWQIATGKVIKKRSNKLLYSRVHVIKNNGTAFNKNLLPESELALMSAAARDAWNIASGSIPVPAVSSSGLVVEGDNVVLGSTGKLMLLGNAEVFIGTSSSNSAVVLNKTGILIASGADIGIASGGSIEIYAGVSGDSGNNGHITIDSPNFKVQSNPASGGNYFYAGNVAGTKYIRYTKAGALEIAGKVEADSGAIGPWHITSTFIGNDSVLKNCNIALRYKDTEGGDSASSDYVAFFSGADGEPATAGASWTASDNLGSAKFKIYKNGKFISTSNDSSITGATILNGKINDATILRGTITSADITLATISSGSITTLDIGSSWYLKTGTYYNFIVNNEKIMNSTAGISVRTASGISSGYTDAVFFAGAAGSGTDWNASKNLASAKFRVTNNGEVYLNALMVQDSRSRTATTDNWPDWPINNNVTHVDIITSNDELSLTGYVPIDFSKLNFNLAVSLVSSTWSGNTFTATVKLWGLLNKTLPITTSILNGGAEITGWVSTTSPALYIKCKLLVTINGDSWGLSDSDLTYAVPLGSYYDTIYNAGWKACRDAVVANAVTRYERSAGTYGGSGTTHYVKDGNNYIDVGKNWYTTTGNTYYTLTNIDETP